MVSKKMRTQSASYFLTRLACTFIAVAALIISLGACEKKEPAFQCMDPIGCVSILPGKPIRIGVLQALSGKVAPLGIEQIRGIELALDARDSNIAGHDIVLQKEDTGCSAEGGANAALKILAHPETAAVIGTTCSIAGAAASKMISEAGMTLISGNNSAPFLTSIGGKRAPNWQEGYFRTASNEEHAGKAAALFAFRNLGIKKAATINDGDIYTRGLTKGFEQAFEAFGGKVVLAATVNKGDENMTPMVEAVIHSKAGMIFSLYFNRKETVFCFRHEKHGNWMILF